MTKKVLHRFILLSAKKYPIIFFLVLCVQGMVVAQSSWDQNLKSENGLVVEQKQHVEIAVNEQGELEIVAQVYEEKQHFGDNANMFSEQSIGYSNTFTEIDEMEAYSLIPTGKISDATGKTDNFLNAGMITGLL
jgi:hypothetical protein